MLVKTIIDYQRWGTLLYILYRKHIFGTFLGYHIRLNNHI